MSVYDDALRITAALVDLQRQYPAEFARVATRIDVKLGIAAGPTADIVIHWGFGVPTGSLWWPNDFSRTYQANWRGESRYVPQLNEAEAWWLEKIEAELREPPQPARRRRSRSAAGSTKT
jgi:hypothetical protein